MGNPASGSALLLGLGREARFGVRDDAYTPEYHRLILPASAGLQHPESPSGEVNASGYEEKGLPGPVAGPIDFATRFSAAAMLLQLENLMRSASKSEIETDVFKYTYEQDVTIPGTSLAALVGLPPVDQYHLFGIMLQQLALNVGNNGAIQARWTGQASHGSRLPVAEQTATVGTYPYKPILRGPLNDPSAGPVYFQVSAAGKFKVEQTTGVPTFPGAELDIYRDPSSGLGDWMAIPGDDGSDLSELGIWDENRDPLEALWPGDAVAHALLDVGDTFKFDPTWDLPTPTYVGGQRFTSAHQLLERRALGASTWVPFRGLTSQIAIASPFSPDQGNWSKYPFGLDRDGKLRPTIQLVKKHTDRNFVDDAERHRRFELRISFLGQLLEGGPYRESIVLTYGNVGITQLQRPAQNDRFISETLNLVAETNDDGDPAVTVEVTTPRDFDVAA